MGIHIPEVVEAERIHKAGIHTPEVGTQTVVDIAEGTAADKAADTVPPAPAAEHTKAKSELLADSTDDESPPDVMVPVQTLLVHSPVRMEPEQKPQVLPDEPESRRRQLSRSRCPSWSRVRRFRCQRLS